MIQGIVGKVGGGKSLLSMSMMLQHFVEGGQNCSNIELNLDAVARYCWKRGRRFHDSQYRFVNMREDVLFHKQIMRGTRPGAVKVFIDEAHLFFPGSEYRALSKQFMELDAWLSQSRRGHVDVYFITQAWENLWGQLRRHAEFIYSCRDMRKINFPMVGQLAFLGLSWTRSCAQTDTSLETGRTKITKELTDCYSTLQCYDVGMSEWMEKTPIFEDNKASVNPIRRLFPMPKRKPPVVAAPDPEPEPASDPDLCESSSS